MLLTIRNLQLQLLLNDEDVETLSSTTEKLTNYALYRLTRTRASQKPADTLRERGIKFLTFDTLYSVSRLAGPLMPSWWEDVAQAVLINLDALSPPLNSHSSPANSRKLAGSLLVALVQYKEGERETRLFSEKIIRLKRLPFCSPYSFIFQDAERDPLREDDKKASEGDLNVHCLRRSRLSNLFIYSQEAGV